MCVYKYEMLKVLTWSLWKSRRFAKRASGMCENDSGTVKKERNRNLMRKIYFKKRLFHGARLKERHRTFWISVTRFMYISKFCNHKKCRGCHICKELLA